MKSIVIVLSLLLSNNMVAQKGTSRFEVTPFFRFDKYPQFTYAINPVNTNEVNIKGESFGINFLYKIPVSENLYLRPGLGFYKYAFNKIDDVNSMFSNIHDDSRIIDDYVPLGNIQPSLIYSTDRYWYNTVFINIGIERHLRLKKNLQAILGADIGAYYTISQNYHITYPSPKGTNYKLKNGRYFGNFFKLNIGFLKKVGEMEIGPVIILPIYDNWKKDSVFPQEENSMTRNKWLKGAGIGFSCNFLLSKKK